MKHKLAIVAHAIPAFFSRPMRYLSILVFSIFIFYPTFDRCIESTQDLHWQSDNSLIAMMVDAMLNAQDSQSDTSDSDDNDSSLADFVSLRVTWELSNVSAHELKRVAGNNLFPDSITLGKFTPPPKA